MQNNAKPFLNLPLLALFGAVILFAASGVYVRISDASILFNLTYRLVFAIFFYGAFIQISHRNNQGWQVLKKDVFALILVGVISAFDVLFFFHALQYTQLGYALLITVSTPLVILPLSLIIYRQAPPILFYPGLIIALIGGYMTLGNISDAGEVTNHVRGLLYAAGATVFFSLYVFYLSHRKFNYSSSQTMFFVSIGALIVIAAFFVISGESYLPPTATSWVIVIALCLNTQIFGQVFMVYAFKILPVNLSSAIMLLVPLVGSFYGWLFFGEKITKLQILGMLICLAGIFLIKEAYDRLERSHGRKLRDEIIPTSGHVE